jgi:hypothetical protein
MNEIPEEHRWSFGEVQASKRVRTVRADSSDGSTASTGEANQSIEAVQIRVSK